MEQSATKKLTSILFLLGTVSLFSNCSETKDSKQWEKVNIDADLSKNPIYKQLDKENEIFSLYEKQDSLMRKSSDVSYFSGKRIDLTDTQHTKDYNCRAYLYKTDTLSIDIGFGTGYGGQGFIIDYKNHKFYTKAYFSTDVIIEGAIEPTHKIIYQKLTLDKPSYAAGDSLFGYVEFKSIETDKDGEKTEHLGKGHFRAKVFNH